MDFCEYTTKSVKEILDFLETGGKGISDKEAGERLKKYGPNEIKIKEQGLADIFFRQLKSPFIYLLFIAALIAFLIGEAVDATVILSFVFLNVALGFFQEARAQKAVSLLKKYIPLKVRVIREGREKIIDKKNLVPGDIVMLEQGNIAPADLRIKETENFLVDETVLSGESAAISKICSVLPKKEKEIFKAKNIVFAGSAIVSGEAEGIVINTGGKTFLGEIAKLTASVSRQSAYEKELLGFSRLILKIVVITIVFLFLANLAIKGTSNFFDFLLFSIALIVSIIPEALPLVVTFSLSGGALKLAKDKAVVKRLSSLEDLGNIEILCSDKTGTLTENKLRLESINSPDKEKCLLYGLLTSSYVEEKIESSSNSFDSALFEKSSKEIRQAIKKFQVVFERSFDPQRLSNSALLESEQGELLLIVKGAPEVILNSSSKFLRENKKEITIAVEKDGEEGKRILAVAFKKLKKKRFFQKDEEGLTFLGYFSFIDPLKPTAKESVALAGKLGVEVKIITGDSSEAAGYVAKKIGLVKDSRAVITGERLSALSALEFSQACEEFSVFARISPQIKYKIVNTLSQKKNIGFLGEGINDAPALKASQVAIAVESAADVSREASDIILLKKDLKVIINAIEKGRSIFSNINKYIKCTIASNFGNFYSIALISLAIPFLPMLPVQILLANLLSDFPLVVIASDSVDAEELEKPRFYRLDNVISLIVILALISTIFDFIFFGIFHKVEPSLLRTLWYIESILTELILIFSIRTSRFFLKAKRPSFSLIIVSLITFLITIILPFAAFGKKMFHFVSPPFWAISIVLIMVLAYFIVSEAVKIKFFSYLKNKKSGDKKFDTKLTRKI